MEAIIIGVVVLYVAIIIYTGYELRHSYVLDNNDENF